MMKTILLIVLCIPMLPTFGLGGWFTNRRNPKFPLVSPMDIYLNISDSLYAFLHRTPKDSVIHRTKRGDIDGHYYQTPNKTEDKDNDRTS